MSHPLRRLSLALLASVALAAMTAACGSSGSADGAGSGQILAVGAENQYANVIQQVGGRYVSVTAIMSNPNTDPHTFEASPSVAETVSQAQLVVQNGLGYDDFMERIEAASASTSRRVIIAQKLLHLAGSTPNPHLWYKPQTMPAVAAAVAADLSRLEPSHASYFKSKLAKFEASLKPWSQAMARFRAAHPSTPVATTEPVGDYLLEAAGTRNLTPFSLQAAIMNGTDPAPQNVSLQEELFSQHRVKVLLYNQQVTDSLTQSFLKLAAQYHVPVVGLYETMPTPGYDYQSWMLAEVKAMERAVTEGVSTRTLVK